MLHENYSGCNNSSNRIMLIAVKIGMTGKYQASEPR